MQYTIEVNNGLYLRVNKLVEVADNFIDNFTEWKQNHYKGTWLTRLFSDNFLTQGVDFMAWFEVPFILEVEETLTGLYVSKTPEYHKLKQLQSVLNDNDCIVTHITVDYIMYGIIMEKL